MFRGIIIIFILNIMVLNASGNDDKNQWTNTQIIILISVIGGGILLLCLLLLIIFYYKHRQIIRKLRPSVESTGETISNNTDKINFEVENMKNELQHANELIKQQALALKMQEMLMKQGPSHLKSQEYLKKHSYVYSDAIMASKMAMDDKQRRNTLDDSSCEYSDDYARMSGQSAQTWGTLPQLPTSDNSIELPK